VSFDMLRVIDAQLGYTEGGKLCVYILNDGSKAELSKHQEDYWSSARISRRREVVAMRSVQPLVLNITRPVNGISSVLGADLGSLTEG